MDYSSQFGLIRQKAAEGRLSFVKILDYYRDRLRHLHTSCPDMAPNLQQYRAEYQTWSFIWPEQPFPGIEPTPPIVPSTAPTSTGTASDSGDYEASNAALEPTSNSPAFARTSSGGSAPRANPSVFPQVSASGKNVSHRTATTTQQQATAKVVQKPQDLRTCGACYQKGHVLADCTRKVDVYGFLAGCPLCNTTKHNIDQCNRPTQGKKRGKKPTQGDLFHFMVVKRVGKPPLRSRLDFRFIHPRRWAVLARYPQTCQFAASRQMKEIVQGVGEEVDDPSWANPSSVKSQIHPLEGRVTSGLLNFTESATPARISNQQLPEGLHLAQQRTSSRG